MLVMTSSKFCETSNDNVPLLVCVIQSAFIIPFNTALQTHNFIFLNLCGVRSKYNECTFAKGSHAVGLIHLCMYIWQLICGKPGL